jgi:hypothetical protein
VKLIRVQSHWVLLARNRTRPYLTNPKVLQIAISLFFHHLNLFCVKQLIIVHFSNVRSLKSSDFFRRRPWFYWISSKALFERGPGSKSIFLSVFLFQFRIFYVCLIIAYYPSIYVSKLFDSILKWNML